MLILYTLPRCPYCVRVKSAFADMEVSYEERSITNETHRNDLKSHGGKTQVPYLIDEVNDIAMYESLDIVEYVRTCKNTLKFTQ